jgi:hypothetical protein
MADVLATSVNKHSTFQQLISAMDLIELRANLNHVMIKKKLNHVITNAIVWKSIITIHLFGYMPLQFAMYLSPVACLGACMWLLVFREFSKYVDKNDDMIKKFIKRRK